MGGSHKSQRAGGNYQGERGRHSRFRCKRHVNAIVSRISEITTQWTKTGIPGLSGLRIEGEVLDNVPDIWQILDTPLRVDVGVGDSVAKHGPSLHVLV